MPQNIFWNRNLLILFSVTLMAVMGISSITPAFPKIVQYLSIDAKAIGWLITAFTLPGVFLSLLFGILSDHFGRKKILIPALFLFALAGVCSAFASDFSTLLVFRVFQGIGAAGLGSTNMAIIGDLFSGKERTEAYGYNASVISVGVASYPAVGGALALLGWNYPFLLSLLAIPVGILVIVGLKNPEPIRELTFNAYLKELRISIKGKEVGALFFTIFLSFLILFGSYLTYFPFLLSNRFAASSLAIGLTMTIASLASAATSSRLALLLRSFSEKRLIVASSVLSFFSLAIMPSLPSLPWLLLPAALYGGALGVGIPVLTSMTAHMAPQRHRGAFMAIHGVVLRAGQSTGPLLMGLFFGVGGLPLAFLSGALLSLGLGLFVQLQLPQLANNDLH